MLDRLYIAATSQHVGKTTSTLGLMAAIRARGKKVSYCKPVGQEFVELGELRVDKDALLFARGMDFELRADIHSPVIIGHGVTAQYLDDPTQFDFAAEITRASRRLQAENDFVIYEGTGHPGVGSVCEVSNAQVAQLLDAPVVMIVEGGIGNTIDKLNMNLAMFRERRVPVRGVIVNKTIPKKLDKVRHYVDIYLKKLGIPLLGVLPYEKSLSSPIMATVRHALNGRTLLHRDQLDNQVENIASGSLLALEEVENLKNLLIIVSHRRLEEALGALQVILADRELPGSTISGIVVTGEEDQNIELPHLDFINTHKIPVLACALDTYGAAIRISQMEVKINLKTPWKIRRAVELIEEYVDVDLLL
ncbi:AAA family ATPase [Neolewinella lacunae]|uniref:AAA family ATPase n=1 Tax=Neolewinella lacunae TaxID=1517758 RepID=A0A923PEF8_9BACT|nr:AAA family ATPase [Neolewinella lacunae]MBC6992603.1 AAA family ATPase [Neolewinella lacunae]MDN3634344.1 AAA family ATPase [Neolewinella lacunae]